MQQTKLKQMTVSIIVLYSIINDKNILCVLCLKFVTVACFIFSSDNDISKVSKQYKYAINQVFISY